MAGRFDIAVSVGLDRQRRQLLQASCDPVQLLLVLAHFFSSGRAK
jgi:hypothetical protein